MLSVHTEVVLQRINPDTKNLEYCTFKLLALVKYKSPTEIDIEDLRAMNPFTIELEKLTGLDLKRAVIAVRNETRKKINNNPK